jgi:DNA polymerase III delta prime subunit
VFLAFLGLPGAGKSTLARALARELDAEAFLEPEESSWPYFVRHPHPNGDFTRLSWFRAQRVPAYYRARLLADNGQTAILDSYYDKWCEGWLDKPGMDWLISADDPYFPLAAQMAEMDRHILPAADVVILLEIDRELWLEQLRERGRVVDRSDPFLASHPTQANFFDAAERWAPDEGTAIIRHSRQPLSPEEEARLVREKLEKNGIATIS